MKERGEYEEQGQEKEKDERITAGEFPLTSVLSREGRGWVRASADQRQAHVQVGPAAPRYSGLHRPAAPKSADVLRLYLVRRRGMTTTEKCEVRYRTGCFPKKCACGLTYTEEDWRRLPGAGIWLGTDNTTGKRFGPDMEMRNCACHSSILVPIE